MAEEDTLLREVDDAVRHDAMVQLIRRYRKPVLAAALALILVTAGHSVWQDYAEKRGGETFALIDQGQHQFESGKYDEAAKNFASAADGSLTGSAKDMAHLWQGRALAKAGRDGEAAAIYENLATKPQGHEAIWPDLACLRLVAIDESKNACLGARGNTPLKTQRDLLLAASLWKQGKTAEAATLLKTLAASEDTPPATRALAQQFAAAVTAPKE